MTRVALSLLIAAVCASQASHGHHSGGFGEPIVIEGMVETVRMQNPHAQIVVAVERPSGDPELWIVTAAPPAELHYLGWTESTVLTGIRIKVTGRPAGLGDRVLDLDTIEFEDGRILSASLPLILQPGFAP